MWKGLFEWGSFFLAIFVLLMAFPVPVYAQPASGADSGVAQITTDEGVDGGAGVPNGQDDPVPSATFWTAVVMTGVFFVLGVSKLRRGMTH